MRESPCYDAEMELASLSPKRWAILALVGLLLVTGVLGSIVWLYQTAQVYPGLAEKIPALQTLVFIRSDDVMVVRRAATYFDLDVSIPESPWNARYELAIQAPSDKETRPWIFLIHENEEDFITASPGAAMLEKGQLSKALSRSSFFRTHVAKETNNIGWARVETFPLSLSPIADILRAQLASYSDVSWQWGTGSQIEIDLKSTAHSPLFPSSQKLGTVELARPLLSLALRTPAQAMDAIYQDLGTRNAALAEGLRGIAMALTQEHLGSASLNTLGENLFQEPALLSIARDESGSLQTAIIGTASDRASLATLVDAISAMKAQGITRSLELNSETTRADVRLGQGTLEEDTMNGWTVSGADGSLIATKGLTFMVTGTMEAIEHLTKSFGETIDAETAGFVDVPWLLNQGSRLPLSFRRDMESILKAAFSEVPATIGWLAKHEPGSLRLTLDLPLTTE